MKAKWNWRTYNKEQESSFFKWSQGRSRVRVVGKNAVYNFHGTADRLRATTAEISRTIKIRTRVVFLNEVRVVLESGLSPDNKTIEYHQNIRQSKWAKWMWFVKLDSNMEYIRNNFLSNRDNIERDLESGKTSGHPPIYPPLLPLEPGSSDNIGHSFPMFGDRSNIASTVSMQMDTSEMQLDTNQKRSWHENQADSNKVRIVSQTSRIPTLVSIITCNRRWI